MSPILVLVFVVIAAVLWFGVLRPKLGPRGGSDGGPGSFTDGGSSGHGRGHGHDNDGDGAEGGDGGGGDGGGD